MSDRRFPEQHEDLQDRARWDEESPETEERDGTSLSDENPESPDRPESIESTDPYTVTGDSTDGELTDEDRTDEDADLDAERTDLTKPDAEDTLPHPDVDARTDVGTDAVQPDAVQPDAVQPDVVQPDAPMPAPAPLAEVPASSDSTSPAVVTPGDRLFPEGSGEKLRDKWQHIQIDFVDDPRHAVEEADTLVEQVAGQLTEAITANRRALRDGWDKQGAGSAADDSGFPTEQLRTTLQQYRSMLNRLLDA